MFSQSERKGIQLRKVLVVEDEEIIRKGIVQLVHTLPGEYAVTEKEHGKAALEHLHANVPDLIISDIRMREMDGLTFLRRAKALYPSVPLMIISGYGDFEYAQQAIRIGVGEFMLKPVNRKAFLLALERLLDRSTPVPQIQSETSGQAIMFEEGASQHGDKHVITAIKSYIADNLDGDLTLQSLAELVHLHPAYISRLFKQCTETMVSEYITQARIERAKYLLSQTPLKIYDVASICGYQSPKHFMLVFKQQTGQTPGAFRNNYDNSLSLTIGKQENH
ncbi:response regulator transcription factor [Paenibacillus odorifer]|uniref:response regulator transcription factor n=1 Tax=Paenibacillus odorifer TaxID=189426 RepID=UPI0021172B29|nr:response regulator [Paenibacillus odorifer]